MKHTIIYALLGLAVLALTSCGVLTTADIQRIGVVVHTAMEKYQQAHQPSGK